MPAHRNEQWENLLSPQLLLVFRIKVADSQIIWSFIWQVKGKSILTRYLLQAPHHVRGSLIQFSQHSHAAGTLSYPCFIAGKTEAQRDHFPRFPHPGRKGTRNYKASTVSTTYFLPGVRLLNGEASTMCETSDHLRQRTCFIDMNTLKPREQQDLFKVTWMAGDRARARTGGTPNHMESNDVFGAAGEQYYGNLKKRWQFWARGQQWLSWVSEMKEGVDS